MPTLEVQPLVLKDVELILDTAGNDYRKHASGVTFNASSSQTTWTGLGGNTHTDSQTPTWTVTIDYVQDWDSPDSLSRFLYEHEGEEIPVTFRPKSGVGPSFTSNVTIIPGSIGGQVNAYATTSATLGCDRPVLVPAP